MSARYTAVSAGPTTARSRPVSSLTAKFKVRRQIYDADNRDNDELPDDPIETSTETLSEPRILFKSSAQPFSIATTPSTAPVVTTSPERQVSAPPLVTTTVPAPFVIPETALWKAPSSSEATSAGVSREASSTSYSYRGYLGFPKFNEIDKEEEERHYQQRLYLERLSVLLHSTKAPVVRRCVKLDQLISDIKSLVFSVSRAPETEPKPAPRARILEKMNIDQWLQVSSEPGH